MDEHEWGAKETVEPFYERPRFLYLLLGGVLTAAVAYFVVLVYIIRAPGERGQFGDTFGGINAVFTGLAFAAVIYGIILQRREIKLQQRELAETREVFKQQSFETSFFNLQSVLAETIKAIEWKLLVEDMRGRRAETVRGRIALKAIAESVYSGYSYRVALHEKNNPQAKLSRETQIQWLLEAYSNFYRANESLLGNYFRLVYNVLKYVSASDFSAEEKERYAHFFRAQLSEGELTLIVLNAMTPLGNKMRSYLEEFAMLKHATMEGRGIPVPRDQFPETAFKDREELGFVSLRPTPIGFPGRQRR